MSILSIILTSSLAWSATELAKVNGRVISDDDLATALGGLNEGQRDKLLKDSNTRRQILNGLIDQEILVQQAEKERLDQDKDFQNAVAAFRKQYLANRLLQKSLGEKLTDKAAKQYYERNKHRFTTDQVHAQHILVETEAQAKDLIKKARGGADFQALAEKHSKDPSAKNNRGDLGFFGRDRMVPEFTEAAFAGKPNEIVGPVKTTYGYHIIKVLEKKPGSQLEFNDVELKVQNDLRQDLTQSYVGGLRKSAKIDVNETALNK
ncbi:MAG: hypothetical protein A2X94_14970 [Bdellovibrionales bacterium GWB1_55_8]|nr:MAG: hypothetical protein A2X94_14970 [Bdellovibrionales bacterium GWB1_55_8]